MAGLLFVMEFRNWTHEEAAEAYMFNVDVQYALNLKPEHQSLCRLVRSERYILAVSATMILAQEIMHDVTAELVKLLDLDVLPDNGSIPLTSSRTWPSLAASASWPPPRDGSLGPALKRHDEPGYGQIRESVPATIRSHAAGHLWMEKARRRRRERTAPKRRRGYLAYLVVERSDSTKPAWHSRGLSDDGQGVRAAVRSGGGTMAIIRGKAPRGNLSAIHLRPGGRYRGWPPGIGGIEVSNSRKPCQRPSNEVQLIVSAIAETAAPRPIRACACRSHRRPESERDFGAFRVAGGTRRYGGDENHSSAVSAEGDPVDPIDADPGEVSDPPGGFENN